MLMVQTGEAHVAVRVPPEMEDLLNRDPNIEVVRTPSVRVIYVAFNTYQRTGQPRNPFADARVRRAVNYAVDNEAINQFILDGVGRALDAPIAPGVFGYQPIHKYNYDPARARQLLAFAQEQAAHSANWVELHNALFGIGGKAVALFPTEAERTSLSRTPEYKKVLALMDGPPQSGGEGVHRSPPVASQKLKR